MVNCCSVPHCKGNYKTGPKVSIFGFPKEEDLLQKWKCAIGRKDFHATKCSKVCIKHFREEDIENFAEAFNDKTGELIRVRLEVRRLKPGVVPSIFPEPRRLKHSNPESKKPKKTKPEGNQVKTKPKAKQVKKGDRQQISSIQKSQENLNLPHSQNLSSKETLLQPLDPQKESTIDLGTESQNVTETSIVIKQEPIESINETPQPTIEKLHCAEEIPLSSSDSFPILENLLSYTNPDSANIDDSSAAHVVSKIAKKRKINSVNPDAVAPNVTKAKVRRSSKPSKPLKRNRKSNPPSVISKKIISHNANATQGKQSTIVIQEPVESIDESSLPIAKSRRTIHSMPLDRNDIVLPPAGPFTHIELGTEFQNVSGTPIVIKQEPAHEPLGSNIDNFSAEEMPSFSCSSTSISTPSFSIPPLLPAKMSSNFNSDSTRTHHTLAKPVSNKRGRKRKINDAKPYVGDATPNVTQDKSCRPTKPSMLSKKTSKKHSAARTSKKSGGRSTSPSKNGGNETREMFQSLLGGSENNPLFDSRASERSGDLFDVFAGFIADKLREMDSDDCAYSLRAILDIVFKAGKSQRANADTSSRYSDQE